MSIKTSLYHKQTADEPTNSIDEQTFLLPFVILSFLTLPSLAVMSLSKSTVGFDSLAQQGYYKFIQIGFWIAVPMALIFGTIYLLRAEDRLGKFGVAFMMAVLAVSFTYIVWPK